MAVALILLMTVAFAATSFAAVATEDWQGNPAPEAVKVEGNNVIASAETVGGAVSNQFKGKELTAEPQTYEIIVELSKDYQHGELFVASLGFGTDAGTYSTEFAVMTQKDGENFVINTGLDEDGDKIVISEPGIYTYRWTVQKVEDEATASFSVVEKPDTVLNFDEIAKADGSDSEKTKLNNSKCTRYVWVFGREVEGNYKLDRDLVMYKEKPAIADVKVVDGADGVTPVTVPQEGQKLTANVIMKDGSTIGSYPVDDYLKYEWTYEGSDTVLGTEPVYTVTSDNAGKTITVKVTSPYGYEGEASWTADDVVGAEITEPEDPDKDPAVDPDEDKDPAVDPDQDKDPVDDQKPADDANKDEEKTEDSVPKTGDANSILPWIAVLALTGSALTGAVVYSRKK